jgi:hypothetical protein
MESGSRRNLARQFGAFWTPVVELRVHQGLEPKHRFLSIVLQRCAQMAFRVIAGDRIGQAVCEQEQGIARIKLSGSRFVLGVVEQSKWQTRCFQELDHFMTEDDGGIVSRVHVAEFPGVPVQEQENLSLPKIRFSLSQLNLNDGSYSLRMPCLGSSSRCSTRFGKVTHLSLNKDAPAGRVLEPLGIGRVIAIPQVGGLHHLYTRKAA